MAKVQAPVLSPDYESYLRFEWDKFINDTERSRSALKLTGDITVNRVLDVGCGAGQELFPFLAERNARGVATDIAPDVGLVGREMYARYAPEAQIDFLRCNAEHLPFA